LTFVVKRGIFTKTSMKKKLAVVIPFHSYPEVLFLTLGTLLRKVAPAYDLSIHIGIHSNYNHYYHKSLAFFDDLRKIAQIHTVDEIDWMGEYYTIWYRYSVMHAKNLINLFKNVRFCEFDYLLILDNDLYITEDFVTKCLERYPDADLIGSYLSDRSNLNEVYKELDLLPIYILPKLSGWHVLMTRKLFMKMTEDYSAVYPKFIEDDSVKPYLDTYEAPKVLPIYRDVMGEFLYRVLFVWKLKFGVIPSAEFAEWVHHYFESSFNFGARNLRDQFPAKIKEIADLYAKEFPNGLEGLS